MARALDEECNSGTVTERQLLHSLVETARSLFHAAASSVFLVDPATGELVFEAVAGEGEARLEGRRFKAGTGIAGWVASTGQAVLADELASSTQFSRSAAESTGYLPSSIMAAPLIRDGECIGVLEVLDRGSRKRNELADLDLLGLVAAHAAISLDLLIAARSREPDATRPPADERSAELLARIGGGLSVADVAISASVIKLLEAAAELLAIPARPAGPDHGGAEGAAR
jgi:GAF domain-containing protein